MISLQSLSIIIAILSAMISIIVLIISINIRKKFLNELISKAYEKHDIEAQVELRKYLALEKIKSNNPEDVLLAISEIEDISKQVEFKEGFLALSNLLSNNIGNNSIIREKTIDTLRKFDFQKRSNIENIKSHPKKNPNKLINLSNKSNKIFPNNRVIPVFLLIFILLLTIFTIGNVSSDISSVSQNDNSDWQVYISNSSNVISNDSNPIGYKISLTRIPNLLNENAIQDKSIIYMNNKKITPDKESINWKNLECTSLHTPNFQESKINCIVGKIEVFPTVYSNTTSYIGIMYNTNNFVKISFFSKEILLDKYHDKCVMAVGNLNKLSEKTEQYPFDSWIMTVDYITELSEKNCK